MRGFHPKGAARAKNYADGGIVGGIKAVLGLDPERAARIAAYKAEQAREKAAAAPVPAPAARGLQGAASALRNREAQIDQAAGYRGGGMVRGPGTGTSDDVKKTVPAGSYIMPADTTEQLGADALGELGKPVPVALSNGEYQMPPEQVHAVGVETLNQIKDATHTPVAARGFPVGGQQPQVDEPRMFFSQGGSPIDEERKLRWPDRAAGEQARQAKIEQWKSDVRTPSAPEPAQPPAPPISPQAAADRQAIGSAWNTVKGASEDAGRAIADVATLAPRAVVGAYDSAVVRPMRAAGLNAGYLSPHLVPDGVDPASMTPFTDQKRMREPAAAAPTAGAGRGFVNPAVVNPPATTSPAAASPIGSGQRMNAQTDPRSSLYTGNAPAPADVSARPAAPAAPTPMEIMPGVYQHGRGQYSDNPNGMGFAPGAGNPSASNIAAADALAARSAADVSGMVARGFQPQQQGPQVSIMGGGGFGLRDPDYLARRNAAIGASSMTAARDRNPKTGMSPGDVELANVSAMQAARQKAQFDQVAQDARIAGDLQQTGMRELGATGRAALQEQGAMTRNTQDNTTRMADVQTRGFDAAGRRALDERRLVLDERAKGVEIEGARQIQALRNTLLDPKATPEQRKQAQENLLALQGRGDASKMRDNFMAVGGGQEWDAQAGVMRNVPQRLIDLRTGQEVGAGGQGAPVTKDSPQVQQIINDTSLSKAERKAKLQALGMS